MSQNHPDWIGHHYFKNHRYWQNGEKKIHQVDDGFVISDEGGWIPGAFATFEEASDGFDEYYRSLAPSN